MTDRTEEPGPVDDYALVHTRNRQLLTASAGVVLVLVAAFWFWARTSRRDGLGLTMCAALYRSAATLADTIRVDGQTPLDPIHGELSPMTCGALRATYPQEVVPAAP